MGEPRVSADDGAFEVEVAFAGARSVLSFPPSSTLFDLRDELEERFAISRGGQKLLGLPRGAPLDDSTPLAGMKRPLKLILMGTPDAALQQHMQRSAAAAVDAETAVSNDLLLDDGGDEDGAAGDEALPANPTFLARIARRVASYRPKLIAGFRPGKKTLVLDVDYTLIDHRSTVMRPIDMARPHLHSFLAQAYAQFDIVIWSATSMKWIELKMSEMGVVSQADLLGAGAGAGAGAASSSAGAGAASSSEGGDDVSSPPFRIAAFVDRGAMITITSPSYGLVDVKPLGVLWGLFPEHVRPSTTIMFDDLRRNFLMNPRHGLRISACRSLPTTRDTDTELRDLAVYLLAIARLETLDGLNHRKWRRYIGDGGGEEEGEGEGGGGGASGGSSGGGSGGGSGGASGGGGGV
jgi:ubiquitin-like domain-containing CTD phosphatase 1